MLGLVDGGDAGTVVDVGTRWNIFPNADDCEVSIKPHNIQRKSHVWHPHAAPMRGFCIKKEKSCFAARAVAKLESHSLGFCGG